MVTLRHLSAHHFLCSLRRVFLSLFTLTFGVLTSFFFSVALFLSEPFSLNSLVLNTILFSALSRFFFKLCVVSVFLLEPESLFFLGAGRIFFCLLQLFKSQLLGIFFLLSLPRVFESLLLSGPISLQLLLSAKLSLGGRFVLFFLKLLLSKSFSLFVVSSSLGRCDSSLLDLESLFFFTALLLEQGLFLEFLRLLSSEGCLLGGRQLIHL